MREFYILSTYNNILNKQIMNRRLVLISQAETPDFAKYWGCGLGNEIYTLEQLEAMDKIDRENCLRVGVGDGILLVGAEPFKYLQQFYHFGIRSENYFDCEKLYRLSIEGGAFVRVIEDFPEPNTIADFLSVDFTKPVDFSWFKQKILKTYEEAIKFLDYLESLPENEDFGFDYEASGMPLDKWFEISGAAICTTKFGGFISFTDIRHTATKEQYQHLLYRLGQFLLKRQEHVWTYNMQYEFQVSHRMLGVDLYNLCDASVVNVLDGHHLKKYSLKWTAQRILGASVWDTEFDRISDLIDSMLFTEEGKLKKDKHKVLKVDQTNFKNTPEWVELTRRYPNYIGQFESLVLEYWGNAFMPIPSDILGFYCNLDAFYTLMIYKYKENEYGKEAWQTFLDNTRLGSRLHSSGLYINEPYRLKYHKYCEEMEAWGITYCATARCKIKMNKHQGKMADITKYTPVAAKLLRQNKFYNGDTVEIAKDILSNHVDTMDISELGLNEGQLLLSYGSDFSDKFLEITRQSMEEAGMIKEIIDRKTKQSLGKEIKAKIDINVARKKKLVGLVGEKLVHVLGLDKFKLDNKHLELEKYLYYERAYNELLKISQTQLNDINNIPDHIFAFGQNMTLQEYSDFISDNYFKCKSPIEDVEICKEFAELYKSESAYLAAILESTQQLPGAEKYYEVLGIKTIEDGFQHFMTEWQKYYNGIPAEQTQYPEKIYTLALQYYNNIELDQVRAVWNNFEGYSAQASFFSYINDQYLEYGNSFVDTDLLNNFFFMRKLTLNYLLYKKYAKLDSTYIQGMFKANNKWVIEGEDHIPLREVEPNEPGAVEKCFVHYEVNTKSSKRWSSGFHTIISHGDVKNCLACPPSFDKNNNIVYNGNDYIMTYFDISSAEVKAAGYASGDPDLISKFEKGEDIYIYTAKLYLGNHFDELSSKDKKMWRKRFKTIFLGM